MAPALDTYRAEWERSMASRRGTVPAAVARLRERAFDQFAACGFPTTREEEWRFTSVAPIAERAFVSVDEPPTAIAEGDIADLRLAGAAAELVFIDGHYVAAWSRASALPDAVRVESLASTLAFRLGAIEPHLGRRAGPFVALNTAFLRDGACIELGAGAALLQPIHVMFITSTRAGRDTMTHPRVLVILGPNSQASVIETYAGLGERHYFTNTVTDIALGENATLDHYTLQYESARGYHIGAVHARAERSATCRLHSVQAGSALARNDIVAVLNGEGVDCALNGLYLADGQRLVDNHTTIDHAQPHCASREIYKGILADRSRGVFNGKIIVRPDAQKTDARQTNRALLLSEDAQINTKPQLEIFANDVKCTHGAAVGQLDDEALFYLRSRGLSAVDARRLLIHAFAADVLRHLPLESVRTAVERRLEAGGMRLAA